MKQKIIRFFSTPVVPALILGVIVKGIANASAMQDYPTLVSNVSNLDTTIFCPVVDAMFYVLLSISIIMVLWAAYLYVMAGEDTDKPSTARKMILYAAIGIVIALAAKGAPDIIGSLFGQGGQLGLQC